MDVKPNDDIIDVLGFLAFEVVRELTVGAVALKQSFEEDAAHIKRLADGSRRRRDMIESGQQDNSSGGTGNANGKEASASGSPRQEKSNGAVPEDDEEESEKTEKRRSFFERSDRADTAHSQANGAEDSHQNGRTETRSFNGSPSKRARPDMSAADEGGAVKRSKKDGQDPPAAVAAADPEETCGLFSMPPAKSSPLMTSHVREAFARLQRDRSVLSGGGGGRPAGGLKRTRVFVI